MQLGMIGLGRMGANLVRRLMRDGHECVVFDVNPDVVAQIESEGAVGSTSLADFASKLKSPRVVWIMVPAANEAPDDVRAHPAESDHSELHLDPPFPRLASDPVSLCSERQAFLERADRVIGARFA